MGMRLSQPQVIAIHAVMAQHCVKGEDGMANFEDGWSDERVLKEMVGKNPDPKRQILLGHIKYLRAQMFGRMRGSSVVEAQLIKLDKRIEDIELQLIEMMQFMQRRHG